MDKYVLTLTPEQAAVVERACEFYSRIRIGQLEQIDEEYILRDGMKQDNETRDDYIKRIDAFRDKLDELKEIAFPNGFNRLEKDRYSEIAWNIYQVTRFERAWNEHPEGGYTVDFHRPIDIGGVGFPEISVLMDK